jgi:hypothetical protein
MSSLQDPGAKVIDLRRWRDERDRRLRAAAAQAAPPPPEPQLPRIPWFTRVLAFMGGISLATFSGFLLSLLVESGGDRTWPLLLALPLGVAALFAAAVMAWAVLGPRGFRRLRFHRAGQSRRTGLEGGLVESEISRRRAEYREDPP